MTHKTSPGRGMRLLANHLGTGSGIFISGERESFLQLLLVKYHREESSGPPWMGSEAPGHRRDRSCRWQTIGSNLWAPTPSAAAQTFSFFKEHSTGYIWPQSCQITASAMVLWKTKLFK